MYGMRCEDCGEVRWSILGRPAEKDHHCPMCGALMVAERRHPGRRRKPGQEERREAPERTPLAKV